jgi:phosphatidylglycerophosphatase A
MNKYKNITSKLIVTCFFIGKIKYAPGTFGSLLAFPINYLLTISIIKSRFLLPIAGFSDSQREFVTLIIFLLFSIVILSIIGVIASNYYMGSTGKRDPKEIVIDEVVGQMLTSTLTFFSVAFVHHSSLADKFSKTSIDLLCLLVLPFILFRLCDIVKPWPIGWIDQNMHSGLGVVLDDLVAGFLAALLHYAIIFALI